MNIEVKQVATYSTLTPEKNDFWFLNCLKIPTQSRVMIHYFANSKIVSKKHWHKKSWSRSSMHVPMPMKMDFDEFYSHKCLQ